MYSHLDTLVNKSILKKKCFPAACVSHSALARQSVLVWSGFSKACRWTSSHCDPPKWQGWAERDSSSTVLVAGSVLKQVDSPRLSEVFQALGGSALHSCSYPCVCPPWLFPFPRALALHSSRAPFFPSAFRFRLFVCQVARQRLADLSLDACHSPLFRVPLPC